MKGYCGDFSFGLTTQGQNFWFNIPQYPVQIINQFLGGGTWGHTWEWIRASDETGKIKIDGGNYFGFKARDLFNNFGYGVTFGYQPKFSMLGVFVNGGYKFRQFRMQPDRNVEGKESYLLNSYNVGVTLRLTPMTENLYKNGISPILEIGTNYNNVFSCKAPYNNDCDQFGKGMSTRIGAGLRIGNDDLMLSVTLSYEQAMYDYFNKDYVAPGGLKPYENINSKARAISFRLQTEF